MDTDDGVVVHTAAGDLPLPQRFRDFIGASDFPCLGAKASLHASALQVLEAHDMRQAADDAAVHSGLRALARTHAAAPATFRSLAVVFHQPLDLDERGFETALWRRVQALTLLDVQHRQSADARTSADPDHPRFSLSFGGEGFFAVGLHPGASRRSRRFSHPTLVFNLHDQFERLRADGRYDRLRERTLERDAKCCGGPNPMLSRHGDSSGARQYSGRVVPEGWHAPFSRPPALAAGQDPAA